MATPVILPYSGNVNLLPYSGNISYITQFWQHYITLLWQHQLYYPIMATLVILPCYGNISYITLLWQHQLHYSIMATSLYNSILATSVI